jgi:hypothetical protein
VATDSHRPVRETLNMEWQWDPLEAEQLERHGTPHATHAFVTPRHVFQTSDLGWVGDPSAPSDSPFGAVPQATSSIRQEFGPEPPSSRRGRGAFEACATRSGFNCRPREAGKERSNHAEAPSVHGQPHPPRAPALAMPHLWSPLAGVHRQTQSDLRPLWQARCFEPELRSQDSLILLREPAS